MGLNLDHFHLVLKPLYNFTWILTCAGYKTSEGREGDDGAESAAVEYLVD